MGQGSTTRGFVLGKFMPPHCGHQLLLDFASRFSDDFTILVCSLEDDPIPGDLRFKWMRDLFPRADVFHLGAPMPQEPADHPDFWTIWRTAIRDLEPRPITHVFASEPYGDRLATELGARFIPFDLDRELRPISSTAVRTDPLANWSALPDIVRPYFVKRVCLFGPESTGKTTLARLLAAHYDTVYAWEHARPLLDAKGGACDESDIPIIARAQLALEDALARQANRILFCDTSLLLTEIWSETLFNHCPEWISAQARARTYDLTLLLDVDTPWVDDAQRYFPDQAKRVEFFNLCRAKLEEANQPYTIIRGDYDARLAASIRAVDALLTE